MFATSCRDEPATLPTTFTICDDCHGENGESAPPLDVGGNSATAFTGVGAHREHLGPSSWHATMACDECHIVPGVVGAPGHVDGSLPADVTFGTLADSGGVTSTWNGTVCSTYCHGATLDGGGATTPTWTVVDGTQNGCDDCHGDPPTTGGHIASGDCSACHDEVMNADDVTFKDASLHIDGIVQGGESNGGLDCSACHAEIWNGLTGGVAKTSRHTIGGPVGTNDSSTDSGITWSGPLSGNAAAARSCVNMCHSDHPHGAGQHTETVHEDALDTASRSATSVATDFNSAATNGGMCVSCHRNPINGGGAVVDKGDYNASAHNYTDFAGYGAWTYTQHDGAVFNRNCTKCHADNNDTQQDSTSPFGAAHFSDYPTLLTGSTNPSGAPGTFVCNNCHGNGSTGTDRSGQDIATDMAKTVAHPVNADANHDAAAEQSVAYAAGGNVFYTNRHVNCLDCHNPHAAQSGNPIAKVSGVQFNYAGLGNFATPGASHYTWIPSSTGASAQYQICLKCHSSLIRS